MIPTIIFLLSIGLQLAAAVIALLLIRTTGRKLAWILIALAMVLMASRRIVTFISLLSAGKEITFTIPELIALVISILMLFGVLRIGKYFRSIRMAEESLRTNEERLRTLVTNIPVVFFMINREGIFTLSEGKGLESLGLKPGQVVGLSVFEFYRDVPEIIKNIRRALAGEKFTANVEVANLIFETFYSPIHDGHGEISGLVGVAYDVTEEEKTVEALAFLANITENATDAIVGLDLDTNIVLWNRGAERIFGYAAEEVVGKSWSMLVPEESLEACRERFKKVIIEGFMETVETVRIAEFGRRFPAEMTLTRLNDKNGNHIGFVSITRDITERKRIEKSLMESEEKYRDLVESANDLIQSVDADMKFLFVNKKWKEVMGYSDEEIKNLSLTDILKKDTIPHCMEVFKKVFEGYKVQNIEVVFVSKNGSEIFVEGNVDAYTKDGKFVSTRGIFRDVTERRNLEEQLRHAQKMQAIGQLAGGIAHEFNNILTTIIGYGDMLLMKMREDDPLRYNVEQILISSERAASLTQGLLTYSRKQATMLKPASLNDIIRKIEGILMKVIGEDIELRTVITDEDLTVMADRSQIEQVLVNLATNARDAMPDGGYLTISTGLTEIDREYINIHGYGESGMYALISVTDTGIGIDKKMMEKIFEPFFTTKEIGKGTGLGLAMVYGIIKQHDGYINVYSEPWKGTTFRIYLPIIKSKVEGEAEPSAISLPVGGSEMVLIAEDDKALRTLIKTVLNEFGYKVIDAVDGEDAVEKFIQNKDEIELAILDVIMPKKNGKEVYEEIKKIRPDIKTIFASGYTADIIQKKDVIEEGMDFILKPVSPKDLLKKVREVLDR